MGKYGLGNYPDQRCTFPSGFAGCARSLYAEFGFEGALIANNSVDGAAIGVSVTNFQRGRPARRRAGSLNIA
jgi:hypothetical protein